MTTPGELERAREARELLASVAWNNGCREHTRDEIIEGLWLESIRVKASDAVEALTRSLADGSEREAVCKWIKASIEGRWHSQNPDEAYRDAYHTGIGDAYAWLVEDIEQSAHLPTTAEHGE